MSDLSTFDEVLDAIDRLSDDQQLDLVDLLRRRIAKREHQRIIDDKKGARREFEEGKTRVMSVDEFMREILDDGR